MQLLYSDGFSGNIPFRANGCSSVPQPFDLFSISYESGNAKAENPSHTQKVLLVLLKGFVFARIPTVLSMLKLQAMPSAPDSYIQSHPAFGLKYMFGLRGEKTFGFGHIWWERIPSQGGGCIACAVCVAACS